MSPRRLAATRRMQHRRRVERVRWLRFAEALRATPMVEFGLLRGDNLVIDETGHVTIHGWRGSDTTITPTIGVWGGR